LFFVEREFAQHSPGTRRRKEQGREIRGASRKGGGQARGKADFEIIIANSDSGRIQEAHTLILHALLEVIEREITA